VAISAKDGGSKALERTAAFYGGQAYKLHSAELMENIGWGHFKVWNSKNTPPLPKQS